MIRHCVLVKYRATASRAERQAAYADLAALRPKLAGMLGMVAGPNVSPEGLAHGFDEGFFIDFADAAARDAYLADEDHQAIGARLGGLAEGGTDGILVFDFELPG